MFGFGGRLHAPSLVFLSSQAAHVPLLWQKRSLPERQVGGSFSILLWTMSGFLWICISIYCQYLHEIIQNEVDVYYYISGFLSK